MKEETRFAFGRNRGMAYLSGISWTAILAGVVVALVVQLMLSVLGVGIGAATVDPRTEQSPLAGLGIGSAIWLFISSIIAMYIGGWIAGRYSGALHRSDGALHGTVTWALTVLVAIYFLTSAAGSLASGTASLLGGVVSTTSIDSVQERARDPQTQTQARQEAREAGEKIATGLSMAGIMGFVALLIGFLAAAFGGRNGVPKLPRAEIPPAEQRAA